MLTHNDILQIFTIIAAMVAMVFILRWRKSSYIRFLDDYADQEVCPHLQPVLTALKQRGHRVVQAGQTHPDLPLEIHLTPTFDPAQLAAELKLEEPIFISDRNVLCCREDLCELHPRR